MTATVVARAPGRVNLIGEHTDYTGGLVMPIAIDRWTEVRGQRVDVPTIDLRSAEEPEPLHLVLPVVAPATIEPAWGRYVGGVAAEGGAAVHGFQGSVSTTVPVGGGLSSSAALEVAVALALGLGEGRSAVELAQLCQRAERLASGVPCGVMDQLASTSGVEGHALLIDCHDLTVEPVLLPDGIEVVVRFVQHRTLVGSAYADRVAQCAAAEVAIGPLRLATSAEAASIADVVVRRRAQHVVSENERVRAFASALRSDDRAVLGAAMAASHVSMRDLFEITTPVMDSAVAELQATPGVIGARMTGGGFGGCVIALCEPGATVDGWRVRPVGPASVVLEG